MVVANPTKAKRRTSYGIAIWADNGSYSDFMRFKNRKRIGFKCFSSYEAAEIAYQIQYDLSTLDLAPRVYGTIIRANTRRDGKLVKTGWGYATEIAPRLYGNWGRDHEEKWNSDFDQLTSDIYERTGLEWSDAHNHNVGYVRRKGKYVMVCIDTGGEGFGYDIDGRDSYCSCSECRAEREE